MESGARMRECHGGRRSVCRPAGEQVRTQLLTLKSHSRVDFNDKTNLKKNLMGKQKPDFAKV